MLDTIDEIGNDIEYDWEPTPGSPARSSADAGTGPKDVLKYDWNGPDSEVPIARRPGANYPDMPAAVDDIRLSNLPVFLNKEFGMAAAEGNLSATVKHYVKELTAAKACDQPLLWKLQDLAEEAHRGRHSEASTKITLAKLREVTKTFKVTRRNER